MIICLLTEQLGPVLLSPVPCVGSIHNNSAFSIAGPLCETGNGWRLEVCHLFESLNLF